MTKEQLHSAPIRAILSGGGTGGHLFPALAVANNLQERYKDSEIRFVGAQGKMEMEKVPKAGYAIKGLWISGYMRGKMISNLLLPFKIGISLFKSWSILKKFQPHIAIGTGGYASAPLLYMAAKMRIPTLIQEQNFFPGITNKFLGKYVDKICVVYENMDRYFPPEKMVVTGNPVRNDLTQVSQSANEAKKAFNLKPDYAAILVTGGSLGARSINEGMLNAAKDLQGNGIQAIWQTGRLYHEEMATRLDSSYTEGLQLQPFIEDMALAYKAADIVVCRAGAITLAELALLGKPAILVPSPNVAEDHQTKNAKTLVNQQAAKMLKDNELESQLSQTIIDLLDHPEAMETLSTNIKQFARPQATNHIVEEAKQLIKKKTNA